jgi:hypothetical protein
MIVSSKLIAGFPTSISKTKNWQLYQSTPTPLTPIQSFNSPPTPREVQELVQELAKFDGVARVRAIAPRGADIHWIDFELELHPETELDYETWDKIQDLVIDCAWDLRDKTNEKWYFDEKVVEKFVRIQDGAKVVARSGTSLSSSPNYGKQVQSSSNFLVVA